MNLSSIEEAAGRLAPHIHRTPVLTSRGLDALAGRSLYFKCEPFQRGGSFKIRGALNAVLRLDDAVAARGVLTHSSGNFAQALAIAAGIRGVPAWIVMPEDAPAVKVAAVRGYGGRVVLCPPTARASTAARVQAETGATFVPSYDHPDVVAGQGTIALELLQQIDGLRAVVAPIGGGGLISGIALALAESAPDVAVWAAEPAGADDAARSVAAGRRLPQDNAHTIADGLRTALGEHTWPVVRDHVRRVVLVDDDEITAAMRLIWERLKVVVEPSGAVGLAAVLREPPPVERVAIVLSGGNLDLTG